MSFLNNFGIGICISCGDTCGPWIWKDGVGWLCEECEESYEKGEKNGVDNRQST